MNKLSENLTKLIDADPRIKGNDAKLSRETKVPQPTIFRIKNGKIENPRISSLKPLAEYFNVSLPELRGEIDLNVGAKQDTPTDQLKGKVSPSSPASAKLIHIIDEADRAMTASGQTFTKQEMIDFYFTALEFAARKEFSDELVRQYLEEILKSKQLTT